MRNALNLIPALLLLAACQTNTEPQETSAAADEARLLQDSIGKLEQAMRQKDSLDPELADQMIRTYFAFARLEPADSLSPEYLLKAANIFKLSGPAAQAQAFSLYQRIVRDYQEHPAAPRALFSAAMLKEANGDVDGALADYQKFLTLYPRHPWADDARNMQAFLVEEGETDLLRVKRWMNENKQKEKE